MIFLRKLLLICIASGLTISTAFAQTLAQWNFDASTNTPTTVPANATISAAVWTADATTTYPAGVTGQSMWARLRAAETMLPGEFACAGRFTMADISLGYAVMLAQAIGLEEQVTPGMSAYLRRLSERAGFQRAKAAQGSGTIAG